MKTLCIAILLLLPLRAFATEITDLYVDESAQTLNIIGHFGDQQGTVTVDSVTLPILYWSDTMISCHIDSDGRGSCGPVVVIDALYHLSEPQLLSWVAFTLDLQYGHDAHTSSSEVYSGRCTWHLIFRSAWTASRQLSASRVSSGSYSYTASNLHDPGCFCQRDDAGGGSMLIKEPGMSDGFDIGAYLSLSPKHYLSIIISSVKVSNGVTVTRFANGHETKSTTDFVLQDWTENVHPTITLNDSAKVIQGDTVMNFQFDGLGYRWSADTVKFGPHFPPSVVRQAPQLDATIASSRSSIVVNDISAAAVVTVFDCIGRECKQAYVPQESRFIQVRPGYYFVRIESPGATKVVPIVVW